MEAQFKNLSVCMLMALTLWCFFGLVDDARAVSLEDTVKHVVTTSPEVLRVKAEKDAATERVLQSRAGYLPKLGLNASLGEENTDNSSTRGRNLDSDTLTRREMGLTLNQKLFDGFSTKYGVAQSEAGLESAQAAFLEIQEKVALDAVNSYIETIMQQQLFELTQDNVLLHQSILAKVKKRHSAGVGGVEDVHQTESRLSLASARLAQRKVAYQNSMEHFEQVVGRQPEELKRPLTRKDLLPDSKERAVELAMKNHFSLVAAQYDLDVARASMQSKKSSFFPDIDLELNTSNAANVSGSPGKDVSASALVKLSYNLFNGGANVAQLDEARNQVTRAWEILEKNRRDIVEIVKVSWNNIILSQKRLQFLDKHVENSQQVTKDYHTQFKMGKRSLLDVLNSENELYDAKTSHLSEEYTLMLEIYKLLRGIGKLQPSLQTQFQEVVDDGMIKDEADPLVGMIPAHERITETYLEYNRQEAMQRLNQGDPFSYQGGNPMDNAVLSGRDETVSLPSPRQDSGLNMVPTQNTADGLTLQDRLFLKGLLERLMAPHGTFNPSGNEGSSIPQGTANNNKVEMNNDDKKWLNSDEKKYLDLVKNIPGNDSVPNSSIDSVQEKELVPELVKADAGEPVPSEGGETKAKLDLRIPEKEKVQDGTDNNARSQNGEFVVFLRSFRQDKLEYVERISRTMRKAGFSVLLKESQKNGKDVQFLYCGPFSTRTEAEKALVDLKNKMKLTGELRGWNRSTGKDVPL